MSVSASYVAWHGAIRRRRPDRRGVPRVPARPTPASSGWSCRTPRSTGCVTDLVVNGVEVTPYVEAELDRRHPVRLLLRSDEPDDLREAHRQLLAGWEATVERMRRDAGHRAESVNDEWSAVQTLRHLVFVHDSWFRRCVPRLDRSCSRRWVWASSPSPIGRSRGSTPRPTRASTRWWRSATSRRPSASAGWPTVTAEQLARPAPVPDDDRLAAVRAGAERASVPRHGAQRGVRAPSASASATST